jgi:hypothetical protein
VTTPCPECGFDWELDERGVVACIAGAPGALRRAIEGVEPARLSGRGRPAEWSPLEYLTHLGDALEWYATRIAQVLAADDRLAPGPDWDALVDEHARTGPSASRALDTLDDVAGALARALAQLSPEGWGAAGVAPDGGVRSVATLARRAAHEAHHHLFDVRRLLDTEYPPVTMRRGPM